MTSKREEEIADIGEALRRFIRGGSLYRINDEGAATIVSLIDEREVLREVVRLLLAEDAAPHPARWENWGVSRYRAARLLLPYVGTDEATMRAFCDTWLLRSACSTAGCTFPQPHTHGHEPKPSDWKHCVCCCINAPEEALKTHRYYEPWSVQL